MSGQEEKDKGKGSHALFVLWSPSHLIAESTCFYWNIEGAGSFDELAGIQLPLSSAMKSLYWMAV